MICNPTVAHFSQQHLHFCHHPSSAFCWVFNPIQTYRMYTREDANCHKMIQCKYLSRSFCTAVGWTSQTGFCLWWLRGWSGFWCRFWCTNMTLVSETALVSLRTLPFFFLLVTPVISGAARLECATSPGMGHLVPRPGVELTQTAVLRQRMLRLP